MRAAIVLVVCLVASAASQIAPPLFRAPVQLPTPPSSPSIDYAPSLTGDHLTLFFTSNRPGGAGGRDVWMSTRQSLAAPWSIPVVAAGLNSPLSEWVLDVQDDGLEMVVGSDRTPGAGGVDLWWSSRPNRSAPWSPPVNLVALNTSIPDWDPSLSADGLTLFWSTSQRPEGGLGAGSIYSVTRPAKGSTMWSAVTFHAALDSTSHEHSPAVTPDGLTMLFASTRTGGAGSSDYYRATRPTASSTLWTVVGEQAELNTTGWEHNGQWDGDGFSFYFTPNSVNQLWVAHRTLPLCIVDGAAPGNPGELYVVIGNPITISCRRDPGDVGVVVGALGAIPPLVLPGVQGTLELNPATIFLPAQIGFVGGNGRYSVVLPIPQAKVLNGVKLHFQCGAQQGAATYLSNRRVVEIRDR